MRRLFAFALCLLVASCGAKQYKIGARRIRGLPVREAFWIISPDGTGASTAISVEEFARLAAVDPAIMGQRAGTHVDIHLTQQEAGPDQDLRNHGFLVETGSYAGLKTQVSTTEPGRLVFLPLPAPRNGYFACIPDIKAANICMLTMRKGDVNVTSAVNPKALRNWSAVVDAYGRVVDKATAN